MKVPKDSVGMLTQTPIGPIDLDETELRTSTMQVSRNNIDQLVSLAKSLDKPSRVVDAHILALIDDVFEYRFDGRSRLIGGKNLPFPHETSKPVPFYTDSVDEALGLMKAVLPGYECSIHSGRSASVHCADEQFEGEHKEMAVALCIAILLAMQASKIASPA
jgi:hypothetical protein